MNNEQYAAFEAKFTEPGRKLLERLRDDLIELGHGPFTEIEPTDLDIERGLEFRSQSDPTVFVELRLMDGDVHGFEGVDLMIECSTYLCGQVWSPAGDVAITSPHEVPVRLDQCPTDDVALCIEAEWVRIARNESTRAANAVR
jgi:hypothetical protein